MDVGLGARSGHAQYLGVLGNHGSYEIRAVKPVSGEGEGEGAESLQLVPVSLSGTSAPVVCKYIPVHRFLDW